MSVANLSKLLSYFETPKKPISCAVCMPNTIDCWYFLLNDDVELQFDISSHCRLLSWRAVVSVMTYLG